MDSLIKALDGNYVLPGPGGDPIRNPGVLPSGKNIHALDPQSIPSTAAVAAAKSVVDKLIERQKEEQGTWPETIACVLWGTDNIKTYGESLAQILWFVGVKPKPDSVGRINKLELIPLEELGRPRIDVVVNCSGVFRDLFINQMALIDQAVKLAAEADEPLESNFVRKHSLEQAEKEGTSIREASARVFSNASGSYSSNVNLAVSILVLILFIILKIFSLDFYLILSVAVLFAVSNFVLMPLINKFRDEKQDKKFKQSHFVSVVINFVQMILLVIVLI